MIEVVIKSPDGGQLLREWLSFAALEPRLEGLEHKVDRILHRLGRVENAEAQEAIDLAALTQKVTASTALDESIKIVVDSIADELQHSSDPVIVELAAKLKASSDGLAEAVRANT